MNSKNKRMSNNKSNTVPRGYRLKPETHELIEKVHLKLKCSKDEVLNKAVTLYYKTCKENNFNKLNK